MLRDIIYKQVVGGVISQAAVGQQVAAAGHLRPRWVPLVGGRKWQ